MKGKKITSVSPLEGALQFLRAFASEEEQDKEHNLFHNEFNNIIVDTCIPTDTDVWETGIQRRGTLWVIVSQYENREEAEEGHKGWVKLLTKDPEAELKEIDMWNIGL